MQFKITSLAIILLFAASSAVAAPQNVKRNNNPSPQVPGGCNSSRYVCHGDMYFSCVARKWRLSPCAPGTTCHQAGEAVYCG